MADVNEPCGPVKVCTSRPVATSQTLTELLPPAAASRRLSALNEMKGDIPVVF